MAATQFHSSICVLLAASALLACGRNDSSPASDPGADLRNEVMTAKPLPVEQKNALTSFVRNSSASHPEGDLYFTADYSKNGLQARFDKLGELAKRFVGLVKNHCQIVPPSERVLAQSDDGSRVTRTTEVTQQISGAVPCPIAFQKTTRNVDDFVIDRRSKAVYGVRRTESTMTEAIGDEELKRAGAFASSTLQSQMTIIMAGVKVEAAASASQPSGTVKLNGLASGTGTMVDGTVYQMTIKYHATTSGSQGKPELAMVTRLKKNAEPELVLGIFLKNGKQELLVNGELYTSARWQAEFGDEFKPPVTTTGPLVEF